MDSAEEKSLTLVDDFVSEIGHALNSVARKPPNSPLTADIRNAMRNLPDVTA